MSATQAPMHTGLPESLLELNHLLTLKDLSAQQLQDLLRLAWQIKAEPQAYQQALAGKSVAMLFEKPSLRTRVSFDIGINKLGGHSVYLDQQNGALGVRETVADFAGNLSQWADLIVARTFSQQTIVELATHGSVPVINALSDLYHPCQALADLLTLSEQAECQGVEQLQQLKVAYVGDGNNVTQSLMIGCALLGMQLGVFCPEGHFPDPEITAYAQALAVEQGGQILLTSDLDLLDNYQAIYTDTWISMGDDTEFASIAKTFQAYQVNAALMNKAQAKYFMHCLPAHRGQEVTDEVMDGEGSLILQQAQNRMHAQNAVLYALLS